MPEITDGRITLVVSLAWACVVYCFRSVIFSRCDF